MGFHLFIYISYIYITKKERNFKNLVSGGGYRSLFQGFKLVIEVDKVSTTNPFLIRTRTP